MPATNKISFTVDSELLRELGERLVGRQYIALAELVKNSFDADASKVEIQILEDCIQVSDNGHGMTFEDLRDRWMRVGSTHKSKQETSPEFKRPLTGSKGVGRLAVQFLASELELTSVPKKSRIPDGSAHEEMLVMVDWDSAVSAGDLTQATAEYDLTSPKSNFPSEAPHGTTVRLSKLKHGWSAKEFELLAREVWFLQPPFRSWRGLTQSEATGFRVDLSSPDKEAVAAFNTQMSSILDLYRSRIVGRLLREHDLSNGTGKRGIELLLELDRETTHSYEYEIPVKSGGPCLIDSLEFEIRIFNLQHRQAHNIPVQQAREYLGDWGGVHIYDAGFRIPYAGAEADWLGLEIAHSHRLHASQLLPNELNVPTGLNDLPTNSRVMGVVKVDTAQEARMARYKDPQSNQHLQIQVSRDRLVSNDAFRQLRDAVRFALDYYATRQAVVRLERQAVSQGVRTPASSVENVWEILNQNAENIPKQVVTQLRVELEKTMDSIREQSEWTKSQSGLLGAMATVGATALAFDHQFNQQLSILEYHSASLESAVKQNPALKESIGAISADIKAWIRRARETRTVFSPVSDERNRTAAGRFKARPLIENMGRDLRPLLRGVRVEVFDIDRDLLLPEASFPMWMAIFHNVLMNASNAMLDSDSKRIAASSFQQGKRRGIRIQDTGVGIDLDKADDLFQPLKRGLEISSERRALGYGGTGLGLAIVKMLAIDLKADVRFVRPTPTFSTCFELAWDEEL